MAVKNIPSLQLHHRKLTAVTVMLDVHCALSVLLFRPTFPFGHPSCLEVAAQGAHPFSEPPLPRHPKEEPLAPGASHLPDPASSRFVQAEIWCQEHREIQEDKKEPWVKRWSWGFGPSSFLASVFLLPSCKMGATALPESTTAYLGKRLR